MKKYIVLVFLLLFLSNFIFCSETPKQENISGTGDFSHDFNGGFASSLNLLMYYILPNVFFEFTFKFDYLFSKKINNKYRLGLGLSIGDSINVGGLILLFGEISIYNFFNRIQQKITFINMVGNDYKQKFALFEVGGIISFVTFYAQWTDYFNNPVDIYYLTFFIAPYFFIGRYCVLPKSGVVNIIGGFMEFNFDIGKHISPGITYQQIYNLYFNIGVEYRIGYHLKK